MLELYLGGARSGKSRLAEERALASGRKCIYLATGEAGDGEMTRRIEHHRQSRNGQWQTVEEPLALASCLQNFNDPNNCIVVDCLTLWLSNLLCSPRQELWQQQREALMEVLAGFSGQIIFVSNEVGQGVVPMGELSRRFVDESGFLHQQLAARCDRVVFVVAGLQQILKGEL